MPAEFIFVNFIFFMLFGIGGASMATVDGVAGDWASSLYAAWLIFNFPWLLYGVSYIRHRHDPQQKAQIMKCIKHTGWLSVLGGISVFLFVGSGKVAYSLAFPVIQTIASIIIYSRPAKPSTEP